MLNIEKVLSRADEITVQEIIGTQTIKILRLVDEKYQYNNALKKMVLEIEGKNLLLLDQSLRNTIIDLLKPEEVKFLGTVLGINVSESSLINGYEKIKKKKFARGSNDERELFTFFDMAPPDLEVKEVNQDKLQTQGHYPLFKHQRVASRNVEDLLSVSPKKTLLHMPTGSGKTRTAMNIIADHFRKHEPTVVIWLAATEELCEQAAEEFEKAWSFLGNRQINVHKYWGNRSLNPSKLEEGLVVAGFPKLTSAAKKENGHQFMASLANRVSFVVVDEAHQAIASTYKFVLDFMFDHDHNKKLLGLSATPGRTYDDVEADQKLANFFSKKKVILEVDGYENPVDYLIDEGYLASVNYTQMMYDGASFNDVDFDNLKEFPKSVLNHLGDDEDRNIKVIYEAIRLSKRHKRIILFAPSVESSESIAFVLSRMGVTSYSLTGSTNPHKRKTVIEDFRNDKDEVKILCNYGVLTTGFDAPQTSAAIIARPTFSLVLYSQMVGRAIRGERAGGNKEAEIVTVVDRGLPGFRSVAESFINWEDVWQ
ncbi:DEAD/DEAH box helicase [Halobacillus yeomjeoni]|uniref:DEAD/DEAH box helicase n=1 Tax=Halobacillus yeomjeoni TaxID=311194 RepID=UPI001CD7ECAC|nr:DEAD/DEAH box helicase [Halobacillus yeomjeoni]MCA0982562.1 DEAD/DEAH box helicase [Halobacillus yeomjeoni]